MDAGSSTNPNEIEKKQLLNALKQPLFIQTPLQAVLEHALQQVQSQGDNVAELKSKVGRLERTQLDTHELLDRIKILEGRVEAATGQASPFGLTDVRQRVQALESSLKTVEVACDVNRHSAKEYLDPRINVLESRMEGVHNLAGRLMALDQIAEELGITPPSQVPPGAGRPTGSTSADAASSQLPMQGTATGGPPSAHGLPVPEEELFGMRVRARHGAASNMSELSAARHYAQQPPGSSGHFLSSSSSSSNSPGFAGSRIAKQQQWLVSIQGLLEKSDLKMSALADRLEKLTAEVCTLQAAHRDGEGTQLGLIARLEDTIRSLADQVNQQLSATRQQLKDIPKVPFAEIALVQSKVEHALQKATSAAEEVAKLKEGDLAELAQGLEKLQKRSSQQTGPSPFEKYLASQLSDLQEHVTSLISRNDEAQAAVLAGEGLATQTDLKELLSLMRGKANKEDMRHVLARSVELALSAYRDAAGTGALATRTKCLVCDRELGPDWQQQQRSQSPHATSGNTLPIMDFFSPTGTAAAATAVDGGITSTGAPLGPGLNAAGLRRLVEERRGSGGPFRTSAIQHEGTDQLCIRPGSPSPSGQPDCTTCFDITAAAAEQASRPNSQQARALPSSALIRKGNRSSSSSAGARPKTVGALITGSTVQRPGTAHPERRTPIFL